MWSKKINNHTTFSARYRPLGVPLGECCAKKTLPNPPCPNFLRIWKSFIFGLFGSSLSWEHNELLLWARDVRALPLAFENVLLGPLDSLFLKYLEADHDLSISIFKTKANPRRCRPPTSLLRRRWVKFFLVHLSTPVNWRGQMYLKWRGQ